jgi:demethylmenaquinone methyltransferase/2-methoxy-6-polyprenyl-1,4-benzoquinol methylase
VDFQLADMMDLPFDADLFDVVSVAYGLRNVESLESALTEAYRVLKPGGRLMVLETGNPDEAPLGRLLKWHFRFVVPVLGAISGGGREAYDYLNRSSMAFPSGRGFCDRVRANSSFKQIEFISLWGGASYLYRAQKPGPAPL